MLIYAFKEIIVKKIKFSFLSIFFMKNDENISSQLYTRTSNERRKISQLENSGCALKAS